jgi:hypothetical protein
MTRNDPSINQDAWLADFTDKLLSGEKNDLPVDGPDNEMRALADTILRLKRAFPERELDPASVKRMKNLVMKRWSAEKQKKPDWLESIRQAWRTPATRQQLGLAFAMIAIAGILIIASPILFTGSGSVTATAGSHVSEAFIWIVLGVLAVCLAWFLRRKP